MLLMSLPSREGRPAWGAAIPTLTFTPGNDSYVVRDPDIFTLSFLAGNDTLTTINAGAQTIATMGDGADVVSHRGGIANVTGDAGADRFEVLASGLTADGGADNDLFNIRGGTGLILNGGIGNDRFNFYSSSVNITLRGGDGDDDFFGYGYSISGSDPAGIYGDAGADYFVGFRGGITLYGGTGNDIYRADAAMPANFVEAIGQGIDSVQVARGDTYTLPDHIENISVSGFSGSTTGFAVLIGNPDANTINGHTNPEEIRGLAGSDRIAAKGGIDTVYGGDGNDYLDGGDGSDWLYGESGDDILQGRGDADTMIGGLGNDTYYVESPSDVVTEEADGNIDLVRVSLSVYTLPFQIENAIISSPTGAQVGGNDLDNSIVGTPYGDVLNGKSGSDVLNGGAGDDTLVGGSSGDIDFGDDLLIGGTGNDTLRVFDGAGTLNGGTGADTINGGDGSDIVIGGADADTLGGGGGADRFVYQAVSDSSPFARDTIRGFQAGGTDTIDLSAIDANSNVAGDQAFTFTAFPTGAAGQLWVTDDGAGNVYIHCEVDGDLSADFQIHFTNTVGVLAAGDFDS